MQIITGAQCQVDQSQSTGTNQHQRTASPLLNGVEGNEGEDDIGNTRDDDVDEHAVDIEASTDENLLRIVEDDICATPLLEHCYHQSQK